MVTKMVALSTFNSPVCFSVSVSTSLDPDIVNGVYWSEALNKVFVENFERDPTLIWQYFGSAKGFFRQYPGESYFLSLCFSAVLVSTAIFVENLKHFLKLKMHILISINCIYLCVLD